MTWQRIQAEEQKPTDEYVLRTKDIKVTVSHQAGGEGEYWLGMLMHFLVRSEGRPLEECLKVGAAEVIAKARQKLDALEQKLEEDEA